MKKVDWITPKLTDLSVKNTESGTKLSDTPDGIPWQDGNGYWHVDIGRS